jgi:PQQ-dependent dehydrogenase (methanol/ethanol family)
MTASGIRQNNKPWKRDPTGFVGEVRMRILSFMTAVAAASLLVAGLPTQAQDASGQAAAVTSERLLNADAEPGQWMSYGRDYFEQRYSPLDQVTPANVSQLGLAWYVPMEGRGVHQESSPLYIDGVIYVTMAWSRVRAVDARTGEILWDYDPKVPGEWAVNACCGMVNRGVAAWNGKVYVGTIDGRLIALDAKTGEEVFDTLVIPEGEHYAITGAPRAAKGLVFIGAGGAELGVRGFVDAYDAETGERKWRFWTVPGNPALGFENAAMRMAAETWNGEWWFIGGGGTVWDSIVYDPVTDLLYVGVGNGSPWVAELRSPGGGDNLFLSSIVALKPDTGEYVWHFQTTPNETWDYTATQPIMVADLEIDGVERHVVMQTPKNGYFYVLDAATGEFISGNNIVPVSWSLGLDENGRPIPNPEARYDRNGGTAWVTPSAAGGHSWHPMSYSPQTGLVYIPARYAYWNFKQEENFIVREVGTNHAVDFSANAGEPPAEFLEKYPLPGGGSLLAWDPVTQTKVWEVVHPQEGANGGTLATAGGLVFQGNGRSEFSAYDATTGAVLWTAATQTGIAAPPITYELDGEQYVAVVAGRVFGGYYAPSNSRLLVYKLGGTAELPEPAAYTPPALDPPALEASAEVIEHGRSIYAGTCAICHGQDGSAPGIFPDLRYSGALHDADLFKSIVIDGVLQANGMVSFAAALTPEDADAVRQYVISEAIAAKDAQDARAAAGGGR